MTPSSESAPSTVAAPADTLSSLSPSDTSQLKQPKDSQMKEEAQKRVELKRVFDELDLNSNGTLDTQELQAGLQRLGLPASNSQVEKIMDMCDADRDGAISFVEFEDFAVAREQELRTVFDEIDTNKNGILEPNEIRMALEKLGMSKYVSDTEIKDLIGRLDTDGVVKGINFEEFKKFLMLFPSRRVDVRNIFDYWFRAHIDIGEDMAIPDVTGEPFKRLIAGGIAGTVSRTFTAPFDRLKILLQAQPPPTLAATTTLSHASQDLPKMLQTVQPEYRGIWQGMRKIYSDCGWKGFFKGNGTNVIKIAPESAVKFWTFETSKKMICKDHRSPNVYEKLLAGSMAGAVSQTAIYPLEITKTRLAVARPGEYKGIVDCIRSIVSSDGPKALFRGLLPSVVGVIPYAGVDFAVYSTLKDIYSRKYPHKPPGFVTVFVCGALSSACGQVVAYPLQLVRTRLQTQGMAGRPVLYNGMADCFKKTLKCDGLLGLYRGIAPNFLKAVPAVSVSYIVYEKVLAAMGTPSKL